MKHGGPDFRHQVALGMIPGWKALRKFGRNDDIDGTEEMWELGTTRVLPTSAAAASTVSDSIQDDEVAVGTGAWTLTIQGLDANYEEVQETISLDGTTPVLTTQTFLRVNRAFIVTAGTGEVNAGNITISVGGNAQAYVEAGEGQTHQTQYTVPGDRYLLVTGLTLTMGRGTGDMVIESQIKLFGSDTGWRAISAVDLVSGEVYNSHANSIGELLPPKTEIRQKCIYSSTNAEATGVFHGYLLDAGLLDEGIL